MFTVNRTPCATALFSTARQLPGSPHGSTPRVKVIRTWWWVRAAQSWSSASAALRRAIPAGLFSELASTSMSSWVTP